MKGMGKGGQEDDRVMSLHRISFDLEIKISSVIVKKTFLAEGNNIQLVSQSAQISVSVLILRDAEAKEAKNA